jgi:hypothetical protein
MSGNTKKEFQEIAHSGGKIELKFDPDDNAVSLQWSGSSPRAASLFQLGVALDGSVVQYWPIFGMDSRPQLERSPIVPVLIGSDIESMWGRNCPKCTSYFRTNRPSAEIFCPYCAHRDANFAFSTKNQKAFIDRVRNAWIDAFKEKKNVVLDFDSLADSLPENRPTWAYSEERQQNRYTCKNCRTSYDILGEYAGCPFCKKRNCMEVFERQMARIETKLNGQAGEQEIEPDILPTAFSGFEGMAKDIRQQLTLLPSISKRKNEIAKLSFQQIKTANEKLRQWFDIEMFEGMEATDISFLDLMVQRRHVFVHNSGRVDQKYLAATGDQTVRLNQVIVVQRDEIARLLPLLRRCAKNLFAGFESLA